MDGARLPRAAGARVTIAQRVLEVVASDHEAVDAAAVACARGLRELRDLDDAWAAGARCAGPRRRSSSWPRAPGGGSRAVWAELEAALASPARDGSSAAQAALALLASDPPWGPRDRRLAAVLAGAPPQERAELLSAMCVRGAPFATIAPHLEVLLTSSDPFVLDQVRGLLAWLKSPKLHSLLRRALPRVVDPDLRAEIEEELGQARASYWA